MQPVNLASIQQQYSQEYLRGLSTFGALKDTTINWLFEHGNLIHLDEGDILFNPGERVHCFYVLIDGRISLYRHFTTDPVLTRHYNPGEEVGFASMIALELRRHNAVATRPSILLELQSDQFFEMHLSEPEEFGLFLLNLSREMARTIGIMSDFIAEYRRPGN